MSDYDPAADGLNGYLLARRLQREDILRRGAWKAIGPLDDEERAIAAPKPVLTGATPDEVWPLVRDFHYSRRMPSNIQHCYALREPGGLFGDYGDRIVAGCVFTIPPTRWSEPVIELARLVRRPECKTPLSSLIGFACVHLRAAGWALAVSFADWTQGHHGGIYQAAGWLYDGQRDRAMDGLLIDGTFQPGRSCNSAWGTRSPEKLREMMPHRQIEPHYDEGKHLYWKPLTVAGKTRAKRLGLKSAPYPKPNATCPVDAPLPSGVSAAQPREVAPFQIAEGVDHDART